mgnify:CR=1 FL=1
MSLRSKIDERTLDQAVDGLKGQLHNLHISIIGGIVWTLTCMALAVGVEIGVVFDTLGHFKDWIIPLFLITAVGWLPSALAYNLLSKAYKKTVLAPLFKQLESSTGLHYSREGDNRSINFSKNDFNRLETFQRASYFTSEDFISGTVDGIDFQCCEARAIKVHIFERKGSIPRYSTIFKGDIYTIQMKEPLKADILISPDFAEAKLGFIKLGFMGKFIQGMGWYGNHRKVVRMDDPVFERLFKVEVVGDDEVGTRYFLTPRFMERLTAAQQLHKKSKFYLETQGDTIYLMISGAPNKFKPHITASEIKSRIYRDIEAIETPIGILKSLNLDLHHINVNAKKIDSELSDNKKK